MKTDTHFDNNSLKENLVRNTTCSEKMVYSAIETTCFGLYWPSSGFYNIEEESINAVKTEGVVDIEINNPHTVFTAFIDSSSIL